MPFPLTQTDVQAAQLMEPYVRPLAIGERAQPFPLLDAQGRSLTVYEDFLAGRQLVLILVRDFESQSALRELLGFTRRHASLSSAGAATLVISSSSDMEANAARKESIGLPFPIYGDASGAAFAALGGLKQASPSSQFALRTVILTPSGQIRAFFDDSMTADHAPKAERIVLDAKLAEQFRWAAPFPPVLFVPHALSTEECRQLIDHFEAHGPLKVSKTEREQATEDFKLPVYEYGRQDRIDHILRDPRLISLIDTRLGERVIPMVRQAFAFDVTRREDLHVARYAGPRGGVKVGHRDNRTATFHRRFALSLLLNDDYEGGEIVFREFSDKGVRCPAGTAVVFSSALLHEILETTQGVRYTLVSHFFNDASLKEGRGAGTPGGSPY